MASPFVSPSVHLVCEMFSYSSACFSDVNMCKLSSFMALKVRLRDLEAQFGFVENCVR